MPLDVLYDHWDLETPVIPKRSLLYCLKPVGIGTPQVESLSGYVARLAEAHDLSVGNLVGRKPFSYARKGLYKRTTFFRSRPKSHAFHAADYDINGMCRKACKWIGAFQEATHHQDLCRLTLVPLTKVISGMFLLRKRRAWCPSCYQDDQGLVYERLLWAIRIVTVCPFHLRPLEERCPFCNRQQPALAVSSKPGFCSACRNWLGESSSKTSANSASRTHGNFRNELHQASAVGEILAATSAAGSVPAASFRRNLRICIRRLAAGNTAAFARRTQMTKSPVPSWLHAAMHPRLDMVLRLCSHLHISPATMLMNDCLEKTVNWKAVRAAFPPEMHPTKTIRSSEQKRRLLVAALRENDCPSLGDLTRRLGYKRAESLYQVDRELCHQITAKHRRNHQTHWWREPGAKRICDEKTLRRLLEKSLHQETATSVRRIAAIARYANGGYIHRKFPDLCHAIAKRLEEQLAKRWDKMRLALESACAGDPPPTLRAISTQLGFRNSCSLREKFPDQCDKLLALRRRHKERTIETLRDKLQPILSEEPAPSLSAVCRRLQISNSCLYERYPELSRAISARHAQWHKERTRQRRQAIDEEVRRIAGDLRARGQNPTQTRIGLLMSRDAPKEWRAFRRSVKRARRFLGIDPPLPHQLSSLVA
jgi:TniQ protein